MSTKSLWGQLPATEGIRTPTQVLKEQATVLSDMTSGVLQGDVSVNRTGDQFSLSLDIVVPALDNYHYNAAVATHGVELYPVTLRSGWDYSKESRLKCADEREFEKALEQILSSEKVRRVIASLLAQSRAM